MNRKHSRVHIGLSRILLSVALAFVLACRQQGAQEPKSPESSEPYKVTLEQVQQWMKDGESLAFLDSRSAHSWVELPRYCGHTEKVLYWI